MRGALEQAAQDSAFLAENVIGIGVDTTGSNPLPVEGRNVPLDLHEQWKDHLDGAMLVMERSIPAPVKRTASPAWPSNTDRTTWPRSATPILPSGSRARSGIAWNIAPGVFDALEVHPLSIGGKQDPVRLVFNAPAGPAITASIVDLGNRFRVIVNEVDSVEPPPKLPVARAVWKCRSDFKTACATWIYAGGAHHTGYSYGVTAEHMEDFAEIAGVEFVVIDAKTELRDFKEQPRQGEIYYHLAPGLGRL